MQDKLLQRVFAQAVEEVYADTNPLQAGTDGMTIMYCFSASKDRLAPSVASEFVRDISSQSRAGDVCALLVVSVPEMRVRLMPLPFIHCDTTEIACVWKCSPGCGCAHRLGSESELQVFRARMSLVTFAGASYMHRRLH